MSGHSVATTIALGVLAWLLVAAPALAATPTLDGGAFGISAQARKGSNRVDVPPSPEVVLPASGQAQDQAIPLVRGKILFSAHGLHVHTAGIPTGAGSSDSLVEVAKMTVGGLATVDGVSAHCTADHSPDGKARTGGSANATVHQFGELVGLKPGASVKLRGIGRVVFDERVASPAGDSITVNALHFFLKGALGKGEIVVGRVRCSVSGGPAPVVPETPVAILLPASAVAVGAVAVLVRRRRAGA